MLKSNKSPVPIVPDRSLVSFDTQTSFTNPDELHLFANLPANEQNPLSPPSFLAQDHRLTAEQPDYVLSSTNPFRNQRRRPFKSRRPSSSSLIISPPLSRRRSSAQSLIVSPATTPKHRTKFHATRPRASPYTPISASFSTFSSGHSTPRPLSESEVESSAPISRRCSMTPRTPAAITVLAEYPASHRSSSVGSDLALSLGTFETLPPSFQLQPSPPCSPNPSPINPTFSPLGLSHASGVARSAYICSSSSHTPPRSPLSATSPNSPHDSKSKKGPTSPGSAPKKAKEILGVAGADRVRLKASSSNKVSTAEIQAVKVAKGRRKQAELARPLPYAKKLEIDAFFGEVAVRSQLVSVSPRDSMSIDSLPLESDPS